jgi:hypothetical protein
MCADSLSGCRRAVAFYAFFAAFRLAAQNFFIRKPTAFLASADILPPPTNSKLLRTHRGRESYRVNSAHQCLFLPFLQFLCHGMPVIATVF